VQLPARIGSSRPLEASCGSCRAPRARRRPRRAGTITGCVAVRSSTRRGLAVPSRVRGAPPDVLLPGSSTTSSGRTTAASSCGYRRQVPLRGGSDGGLRVRSSARSQELYASGYTRRGARRVGSEDRRVAEGRQVARADETCTSTSTTNAKVPRARSTRGGSRNGSADVVSRVPNGSATVGRQTGLIRRSGCRAFLRADGSRSSTPCSADRREASCLSSGARSPLEAEPAE
jgi:hypothetical protein